MVPSADDRASKVNNGLLIDDKLIFLPANGSMTWLGRRDISYCLLFFISRNNLLLIAFCCRDHKAYFLWMRDCVAGEFRSSHVASEVSFLMASQSPAVRGMRRGQRRGPPPQLSSGAEGSRDCREERARRRWPSGPLERGRRATAEGVSECPGLQDRGKRAGAVIKRKHTSVVPAQSLIASAYSTRFLKEF